MTVKYRLLLMTELDYKRHSNGDKKPIPTKQSSVIEILVYAPKEFSQYQLHQLVYNAMKKANGFEKLD